jgi:hypothetical protein
MYSWFDLIEYPGLNVMHNSNCLINFRITKSIFVAPASQWRSRIHRKTRKLTAEDAIVTLDNSNTCYQRRCKCYSQRPSWLFIHILTVLLFCSASSPFSFLISTTASKAGGKRVDPRQLASHFQDLVWAAQAVTHIRDTGRSDVGCWLVKCL